MNAEKIVVLSCLLSLTGAAARAQGFNWNADPVAQFRAAESVAVAVPRAVEARAAQDAPMPAAAVKLAGRPVGSDRLWNESHPSGDQLVLILNNGKDRVGAAFTSCAYRGGDDSSSCEQIDFVFPQLTVDLQAKAIKLGDETVATLGGFWKGTRLVKGWRLVASRTRETVDGGFNRYTITRVAVTLEK